MTAYRRTHLSSRTVTPPQPAGLYTVFVRDLLLDAKVGIHAHERELAQRIRINIELDAEMPAAGGRGHIDEVVCYEDLVTRIRAVVTRAHVGLMETL
ncbi:MAG: dihydroneopterin aldolase, partial [Alphaproteobacteria bacterium]